MQTTQSPSQVKLPIVGQSKLPEIDLEAELRRFEEEETARLGLAGKREQWRDDVPQHFTKDQRPHTTLLVGGLTHAQDLFIAAALRGIGYRVMPMDVPDSAALSVGKEFGNRGQCNPTYFTVGNLVKYLQFLRDRKGLSVREIVEQYVFVTAGACGPCRFGTYVTEYRKALRDAGFDGFRVMLFQQQGGLKQATGEAGLDLNPTFFLAVIKAIFAGDVLNALAYRIRPFEVEAGSTDRAVAKAKEIIGAALQERRSVLWALVQARRQFAVLQLDRTRPKPKVSVIGEFWAMTTEGDGNYQLQKFLEAEGAEVEVQLVAAWVLYTIWEQFWDTKQRMYLRHEDNARKGLVGVETQKKLLLLFGAEHLVRGWFQLYANLIGLHGWHLPDMDQVAATAADYYNNHLRGGEGHMEVGKLILNVAKKKATMTLSVKPFGCMPSSGVSDGVQSLVTEKFPGAIFCPIETSGDGAVNVYSRVQMMLFKAKLAAEAEYRRALEECGMTEEQLRARLQSSRRWSSAFFYPRHSVAGTAANLVYEVAGKVMEQPLGKRLFHLVVDTGKRAIAEAPKAASAVMNRVTRRTAA